MAGLFKKRSGRPRSGQPDADGDVAGLRTSSWSARIGAHVAELQAQLNGIQSGLPPARQVMAEKIGAQLRAVRVSINAPGVHLWRSVTGRSIDRAISNMHEAEVQLLRLLPEADLKFKGITVLELARRHLDADDRRYRLLDRHLRQNNQVLTPRMRELAAITLHAAYQAEDQERARIRSFSYIVTAATVIMLVLAAAFVLWGSLDRQVAARFCSTPSTGQQVCPLGGSPGSLDVLAIAFSGMVSAALAGALSLRKMQASSGPYHVGVCLLVLRLPVGALSALLGVLLISGRFFPGLTSLDTSSQIIAWAIAFGILQESVTRTVDKQGRRVLENVNLGGAEPSGSARE
ncbi:hypothetical protein [Streptomyces sp. NPDC018347]|uniref:hypothetical protein n=1 Tax=Streptomyces sp. NPDC018347 TaxID=3157193 RepID=UPI0033C903DF